MFRRNIIFVDLDESQVHLAQSSAHLSLKLRRDESINTSLFKCWYRGNLEWAKLLPEAIAKCAALNI